MITIWKNWKAWLLVIVLGAAFGLLDASEAQFIFSTAVRRVSMSRILIRYVSYWATFAALVPLVFLLAERFPLDRPPRTRALVIHTLAAIGFVLVHLGAFGAVNFASAPAAYRGRERFLNPLKDYAAGNFVEYWSLIGLFYAVHYYHEARRNEVRAARLQAHLSEAKLQTLRSQLNPHFLFNTLNTIFVLAQKNDRTAVLGTLSCLSDLLRATLDDSRPQEIPLADEIGFLERYVEIERTRFTDRLTVQYSIAPETEDALVPSMLLQPLVENAIRYSVAEQTGRATVMVDATRSGDALCLKVSDNGPGFLSLRRDAPQRGIGLSNTEARLEHLYGRQHHISYHTIDPKGGVVTVSFPFRTGPETFAD